MRRWIILSMVACVACFALTGCDKLDDSDGEIMNEILPGKWSFSYIFKDDADPGLEFEYKFVLFNEDKTCALTYDDGALNGTYQATIKHLEMPTHVLIMDGDSMVLAEQIMTIDKRFLDRRIGDCKGQERQIEKALMEQIGIKNNVPPVSGGKEEV